MPNAMSGSGRRPLLNGSQAARNTAPAVSTATRLTVIRLPSRGSTQRLMISQVAIAAAVAGSRIQTPAVLIDARWASTLWYQSNGASRGAEEPVVVGGVAGIRRTPARSSRL